MDKTVGNQNGYYGYFYERSDGEEFVPYGRDVRIANIYKNIDDSILKFKLKYIYANKTCYFDIKRSEAFEWNGFAKMRAVGIDLPSNQALSVFTEYLSAQEEAYFDNDDIIYFHTNIGWMKIGANWAYKHYKSHGFMETYTDSESLEEHAIELTSKYDGTLDIKPKGKIDNYCEFLKTEVLCYTPAQAALIMGLSAVICSLLQTKLDIGNPIIHLYGDSSIGKTTAAQLAVSAAGNPTVKGDSLMKTWSGTLNAIITRLAGWNGVPVAFDEISKCYEQDLSGVVYALSDGRDKDRLTKEGTLKGVEPFSVVIISTGESSLFQKCRENTGLKVRMIEFNTPFTMDAEHSERIKEGCKNYHGKLAPMLASYIIKKSSVSQLADNFEDWKDKFKTYLESKTSSVDSFQNRISNYYALFILTAELANRILKKYDVKFDIEALMNFFADNEIKNNSNRDIADIAYEKVIEYINKNSAHFYRVSMVNGNTTVSTAS